MGGGVNRGRRQVLGMPLDRNEERMGRKLEAFDQSVSRARRDGESADPARILRVAAHGLMVAAVHLEIERAGERFKAAPFGGEDPMGQEILGIRDAVPQRGPPLAWKVLIERAARGDA